jgi:hypothetical protein
VEILLVIAAVATAILLWLNSLASLAVKYDHTLDKTQKIAQTFIVWLVPFFGAAFVLHLVSEHYPQAIPRNWIPWPFKKMVFGAKVKPNKSRDDREIDHVGGSRNHSARESHDVSDGD